MDAKTEVYFEDSWYDPSGCRSPKSDKNLGISRIPVK
jgi:hypothetical protein